MLKIIIRWLICPVFIGLIPIFLRIIIWYFLQEKTIELFNTSNLIAFGLLLNIHSITQRKYLNDPEKLWNQFQTVAPIFLIILYSVFFAIYLADQAKTNNFDTDTLKTHSMLLNVGSLCLGITICVGTSTYEQEKNK